MLPDPVTCFSAAKYEQFQKFYLDDAKANLVLVDWCTSGRRERGEIWYFNHYRSTNHIMLSGKPLFLDSVLTCLFQDHLLKGNALVFTLCIIENVSMSMLSMHDIKLTIMKKFYRRKIKPVTINGVCKSQNLPRRHHGKINLKLLHCDHLNL